MDIAPGLPAFNVVGLPDTAIQEARDRVRAAIRNSDCSFPMRRITVNPSSGSGRRLAPAELKKEGAAYDLPMAVAILLATEQVPAPAEPLLFLGELSLDGTLRHTRGILPMVALARDRAVGSVVVPAINAGDAALIGGLTILLARPWAPWWPTSPPRQPPCPTSTVRGSKRATVLSTPSPRRLPGSRLRDGYRPARYPSRRSCSSP